jgi:transcriptional regulator with XRE-family HTH domain
MYGSAGRGLRRLREATGLNALQLAARVGCPVGTIVRAEMGLQVPVLPGERARLAAAYGVTVEEFVRLALDAADMLEGCG